MPALAGAGPQALLDASLSSLQTSVARAKAVAKPGAAALLGGGQLPQELEEAEAAEDAEMVASTRQERRRVGGGGSGAVGDSVAARAAAAAAAQQALMMGQTLGQVRHAGPLVSSALLCVRVPHATSSRTA